MNLKIKKTYEVKTSKSISEIKDIIEFRSKRQNKNKLLLVTELVNYKKLKIIDDTIEIERNPVIGNPFGGIGYIRFELDPFINGTKITCVVDPSMLHTLVGFGSAIAFLLVLSFSVLLPLQNIHFNVLLFVLFAWFIVLGMAFLLFKFNRFNLESYSKTVLYDLGLLSHDK